MREDRIKERMKKIRISLQYLNGLMTVYFCRRLNFSFAVILSVVAISVFGERNQTQNLPKPGKLNLQNEEIPCTALRYANIHTRTSKVDLLTELQNGLLNRRKN